jgi:hypothetical protein
MMNAVYKTKQAKIISVLVGALTLVFAISWYIYPNRCHFMSCTYASWETIQAIVFAQTDNDPRIDYVIARPSKWNSYSASGPTFIDIDIGYWTKLADGTGVGDMTYRLESIQFDDKILDTHHFLAGSLTSEPPTLESQQILKRVKLHPRDAFGATWKLAQNELQLDPKSLTVIASLLTFDGATDGHESIWHIFYGDKLDYYVDAQTGEIISTQKWP